MGEGGDGVRSTLGNRAQSCYHSCLKGKIEIKMKKIILKIETKHAEFPKGREKKKYCGNPDFSKMSAERFCFLQALTTISQLQCQVPLVMQGDVEGDESQERLTTASPAQPSPAPAALSPVPNPMG